MAAAGVNRPDAIQRAGNYPPPAGQSDLPGLEVSGEIVALGDGASGVSIGDTVCALTPGGGYAEYCIAPASHCLPVPDGISVTDAAGIPETSFTVWHNVFQRPTCRKANVSLCTADRAASAQQRFNLPKRLARKCTTAGSREKCDACEALGADLAIN